jgi:hypothetical protein
MNTDEHLLTCVNEESGEIAQIALRISQATCKAPRFGMDDGYPRTDHTNHMDLVREVNDLIGALERLVEAGVEMPGLFDREPIDAKKNEHQLTCVNEESGEIAQIALRISQATCKALRFGMDDGYPGTDRTNRMDLVREVNDLIGALERLVEAGVEMPGLFDREAIEAKKKKIEKWMSHAKKNNALQA